MLWRQCRCVGLPPQDHPRTTVTLLQCALAVHHKVIRAAHGKRKTLDTRPRHANYYDVLQVTPKATQAQVSGPAAVFSTIIGQAMEPQPLKLHECRLLPDVLMM